ncbi:MAG TPA: hypothetical protein VGY91_03205 [Chthoniobacterales bacterium]|jgi:hypothetical protein|nr:hypothetical protein [Chthoniobacterales bacterium]
MTEHEIAALDAQTWAEICSTHSVWWRTWMRAGNPQRAATALELAILARDERNKAVKAMAR